MEILRVPSYATEAVISVTNANTEYSYTIQDMADLSVSSGTVTSDSSSNVAISLPGNIDGTYTITVDDSEEIVDVVRPYVDPTTKATTATEIAAYTKNEELARAIIDSIVSEGFYYKKEVIQTSGLGADYLPLNINAKKILKVYENNVLVYDAENPDLYDRAFEITHDGTAIVQSYSDAVNRREGSPVILPLASSDSGAILYYGRSFAAGVDYVIFVESGYKKIPSEIVRAAELLVDDIDCGKMEYYKRYASSYNTDQFKIQFEKQLFEGTGNLVVDKILSKYINHISRPGVL